MTSAEQYVSDLEDSEIHSISRLLAQISSLGLINSGHWLLRLMARTDIDDLYLWSVRFGQFLSDIRFNLEADYDEFLELFKLRQFSMGISSGLIDRNKLSYLQFFNQYLHRNIIFLLTVNKTALQRLLRLDDEIAGLVIYDPKISENHALVDHSSISLSRIIQLFQENRLPTLHIRVLTVQLLDLKNIDPTVPFTIYQTESQPTSLDLRTPDTISNS